jgi:hypothetical protein
MRIGCIALSLTIASSLALAQAPQGGQHIRQTPEQAEQRFEQHLVQRLSMTSDQQSKLHAALVESRTMSQGMTDQMRTLQTSLHAAIKAGSEDQIDSITRDIASLHQQQTAISAKATAKIYSTLTTAQKNMVGEHLEMIGSGGPGFGPRGRDFGAGFGRGFGAGFGRGPAQQ